MEPAFRTDIPTITAFLSTMHGWVQSGMIDAISLGRVREDYEKRLDNLRTRRNRVEAQSQSPAPSTDPDQARSGSPFDSQGWVAQRQADVLLYLGAFLLVISALIFVSNQGELLATGGRVVLLAAYTTGFLITGFFVRRWSRVREAGPIFLAIGALLMPLNFVLLYTEVLAGRGVEESLIWFAGSSYSAVFYGALFRRGFSRLYSIPVVIAVHVAWGSLFSVLGLPSGWVGAWWMGFAGGTALTLWRFDYRIITAVAYPLVIAVFALLASYVATGDADALQKSPLPVTYALLTISVMLNGYLRRFAPSLMAVAIGGVATAIATLWAFGIEPDWYAYPALAVGAIAVGSRRLWAHRSPVLSHGGWLIGGAGALFPVFFLEQYGEGTHGIWAFVAGSAVLAVAAWHNVKDGVLTRNWVGRTVTLPAERVLLAWIAFAMFLTTVAFAQRELGISRPDTGWSYTMVASLTIFVMTVLARRDARVLIVMLPPFVVAVLVSLQRWDVHPGHDAFLLGLPAAELLIAFVISRRWILTVGAAALAVASTAAAWGAADWEIWTLALTYAGFGALLLIALTSLRQYAAIGQSIADARALSAILVSWGIMLSAPVTALFALAMNFDSGLDVPSMIEYRILVGLVAIFAIALAAEGWSLGRWDVQVPVLVIGCGAVAAAWPAFEFEWWTLAPVYGVVGMLIFFALTSRRRYTNDHVSVALLILSWGTLAVTLFAAGKALELGLVGSHGTAVKLVEYHVLIGAVLLFAPALVFEGWRLGQRSLYLIASAVIVAAIVMIIGIAEPSNVQAYTIPVAIYLASVGLVVRRSEVLFDPHLQLHELITIVGAVILVLPQVEQGFEPGGSGWALVLLAEGTFFLALAFTLGARWLAVSGVLTVSGVAIRALYVSHEVIPYWLMLGVAGLFLLAVGFALLLQREWWDNVRIRVSRSWVRHTFVTTPSTEIHVLALLSVLAPAAIAAILSLGTGD